MTMSSPSTRILGGAQFNSSFSASPAKTVEEGCTATIPAAKDGGAEKVPVSAVPKACFSKAYLAGTPLPGTTILKDVPAADVISPEQAAANVLELAFDKTPAGAAFGGTMSGDPLNYLQIYYLDITYAATDTSVQSLPQSDKHEAFCYCRDGTVGLSSRSSDTQCALQAKTL